MKKISSKEAMLKKYKLFMSFLSHQTMTADEIKKQNPALLKKIYKAIETMDNFFNRGDYQGFRASMKRVRNFYFETIHKNSEMKKKGG
ncbi:MAG: hypothetical protein L0956_07255 [Candidatus Mariimomonas ferrooxydans]